MRLAVGVIFIVLICATGAHAGEWHVDSLLQCGNCHLQHASKDGQPLPGGPFSTLLVKSTINELCLSCHDGSDPTAPDVLAPVTMYQTEVSGESGGGLFGQSGLDNPHGHALGVPSITPLQIEGNMVELSCASCHAVHGNKNYRNLLHDPAGKGDSILITDPGEIFTQSRPAVPPTSAGSSVAYSRDNIVYVTGISAWCTSCHNELAQNSQAVSPAHFNAHPSDVALDEFSLEPHADANHWVGGTGEGFAPSIDNSGIERVPYQSPLATDFISGRSPAITNQVFCGSCHKAHGSQYQKSLLWPYLEGGETFVAGCQQCHNK